MTAKTVWKNPQDSILGAVPDWLSGTDAVDGDAVPFVQMAPGSKYTLLDTTNELGESYEKRENFGQDEDWGAVGGMLVIQETFAYSDMADGGGAAGTYTMNNQIPVGAYVLQTAVVNVTGFAGDTSASLDVGDGSDVDAYTQTAINVFADVAAAHGGSIATASLITTTAVSPVVTITSGSDWGSVTAGQVTVRIYCLL